MSGMKKAAFWCLPVFLLAVCSSAQDAKISLRTLQLGGDEMPESWVRVADAKEPVELPWLTSQPTEPIQVVHDGQLKLLHQATDPEGKPVLEVMKVIKLPAAAKEVLLLGWASDGKAMYVAIEDQFLNAKFNDWIAINTSPNPVAVRAGDKGNPVIVKPGESVIFSPAIRENKGVKVLAQTERNGELKTFLSSYWPAFPGQRTMMIFYDDGEKMRARRIGDRFLKKEEKPGEE